MFHVTLKLRLVDVNYNFERDWTELSNNKLSDNRLTNNKLSNNNLASERVEYRSFLNQSQSRKIEFCSNYNKYYSYTTVKVNLFEKQAIR